jgi:hypothetical protein
MDEKITKKPESLKNFNKAKYGIPRYSVNA